MLYALKTYNKDILRIILNFLNFILSTNTTELFKQGESNVILTLLNYFQSLSQHLLQRLKVQYICVLACNSCHNWKLSFIKQRGEKHNWTYLINRINFSFSYTKYTEIFIEIRLSKFLLLWCQAQVLYFLLLTNVSKTLRFLLKDV